jgi:hypothetical protein
MIILGLSESNEAERRQSKLEIERATRARREQSTKFKARVCAGARVKWSIESDKRRPDVRHRNCPKRSSLAPYLRPRESSWKHRSTPSNVRNP